jgi:hypothetical protein
MQMKLKTNLKVIAFIISLFVIQSCNVITYKGKIKEGTIIYDIVYLQDDKANPLISILPTTMVFKFKNDMSSQKIDGWMGIFQMTGIADRDEKKRIAILKIMNDKFYYETDMNGPGFGFDEMKNIRAINIDSVKTIAGLSCKCAQIYIGSSEKPAFTVFYTDKIKLNQPNCNNPFSMIDGVLMQFQMSFQKIPMLLTARKVVSEEVSDDEFRIPDGYSKVSRDKMQAVISNLM